MEKQVCGGYERSECCDNEAEAVQSGGKYCG